jgi:hypothetical protein
MKTALQDSSVDSFADQSEESDNPFTLYFKERAEKIKQAQK